MSSGGPDMQPEWSALPPELLSHISQSLTTAADLIRFRATCSSWRSAAAPRILPPSFPWLAFFSFDDNAAACNFLSLSDGKIRKQSLPNSYRHKQFFGAAAGWFVVREKGTIFSSTSLLNPITGAEIHLPPLKAYPLIHAVGSPFFIKKIALSSPVAASAVAILGWSMQIALARPGAGTWTMVGSSSNYHDALFFRGRFHIVDGFRRLFACEDNGYPRLTEVVRHTAPRRIPFLCRRDRCYLAESAGDLMLLIRHFDSTMVGGLKKVVKTTRFEVFKVDPGCQDQWVEVESLGNRSLFLGLNHPISICASKYHGCRENCIYFADDMLNHTGDVSHCNLDAGVFNLSDGSIETLPIYNGEAESYVRPPPVWFSPSLL